MKEAGDVLSYFSTQAGAARFFALLFPGFVALAVYDLRVPGERRKLGDMGVALVAYSVLIDGVSMVYLSLFPIPQGETARMVVFGLVTDVLVPALIGWFAVDIRQRLAARGFVLSAMPTAWDEFFGRLARLPDHVSVALVITLSDGRKVGGFWAESPFASSFPNGEDLLIPVPVTIEQGSGRFQERVLPTRGLLLKRDDIISIEAFDGVAAAEELKRNERNAPAATHTVT